MILDASFLTQLNAAMDSLLKRMNLFSQARVLVVGDLTLDEFLTGQVERLSREAPVLILRHEHTHQIPGGCECGLQFGKIRGIGKGCWTGGKG